MRLVTVFRVSLMMVSIAAIAVPVHAQTTPEAASTATVAQPVPSEKASGSENSPAAAPAVVAQTSEAPQATAPVRTRIPLSSRIFPAASMEQ